MSVVAAPVEAVGYCSECDRDFETLAYIELSDVVGFLETQRALTAHEYDYLREAFERVPKPRGVE